MISIFSGGGEYLVTISIMPSANGNGRRDVVQSVYYSKLGSAYFAVHVHLGTLVAYARKLEPKEIIEFFTIFPQYKNANIADFVLTVPFKIKRPIKSAMLNGNPLIRIYFSTKWNN